MKVCDLTQSYAATGGGVRTYLHAKRSYVLERTEAEHVLIVPGAGDDVERGDRAVTYGVAAPPVPGASAYRCLLRLDKVLRILRAERPDVIELQSAYNLAWTALYHRRSRPCRVVGVYMTDFAAAYVGPAARRLAGRRAGGAVERLAERYARALYRRCDATVAISPTLGDRLERIGVPQVERIPLGVDAETFHPARRDPALRRRLGAEPGDRVLIYAGRLDREKRPDRLVAALDRLPASTGVRLVLVGDGPLRPALAARARADRRLRVLPFETDRRALATLLASADVYASAMAHETFGLSVLEAQACGLPVIGVRAGAMVDRVAPGTGVLVPRAAPDELARAITAFSDDEWRAMGRRARRHVRGRFSWRATFDRLFGLYRRLHAHEHERGAVGATGSGPVPRPRTARGPSAVGAPRGDNTGGAA